MSRGDFEGSGNRSRAPLKPVSEAVAQTAFGHDYPEMGRNYLNRLLLQLEADQVELSRFLRQKAVEMYASEERSLEPEKQEFLLWAAALAYDLLRRQALVHQLEEAGESRRLSSLPLPIVEEKTYREIQEDKGYFISENYVESRMREDQNFHLIDLVQQRLTTPDEFYLGQRVRRMVTLLYGIVRRQAEKSQPKEKK